MNLCKELHIGDYSTAESTLERQGSFWREKEKKPGSRLPISITPVGEKYCTQSILLLVQLQIPAHFNSQYSYREKIPNIESTALCRGGRKETRLWLLWDRNGKLQTSYFSSASSETLPFLPHQTKTKTTTSPSQQILF